MSITQNDLQRQCRILTEHYGIQVICQGGRAYTNGKTVVVPALSPVTSQEVLNSIRYFLDHESGHIVGKSDIELLESMRGKYGAVGKAILNALEDRRIEKVMSNLWAGSGINVRVGAEWVLSMLEKKAAEGDEVINHPLKQLISAVYLAHRPGMRMPSFVTPKVVEIVDRLKNEILQGDDYTGTADLIPLAEAIVKEYAKLKAADQQPEASDEPDNGGGDSSDMASGNPPPAAEQQDEEQQDDSSTEEEAGSDGANQEEVNNEKEEQKAEDDTDDGSTDAPETDKQPGSDESGEVSPTDNDKDAKGDSDDEAASGASEDAADAIEEQNEEDKRKQREQEKANELPDSKVSETQPQPQDENDAGDEASDADDAGDEGDGEASTVGDDASDERDGDGDDAGTGGTDEGNQSGSSADVSDEPGTGEDSIDGDEATEPNDGSEGDAGSGGSGAGTGSGDIEIDSDELNADIPDLTDLSADIASSITEKMKDDVKLDPIAAFSPYRSGLDLVKDITVSEKDKAGKFYNKNTLIFKDRVVRAGGSCRQRLLQLLLSEDKCGWRNGLKRGSPDPRSLYKLVTNTSDRVMRRAAYDEAPDTAALLLLDMSGSMAVPVRNMEGGGGFEDLYAKSKKDNEASYSYYGSSGHHAKVIDYAIQAAASFAQILDSAQYASMICGFTEGGSQPPNYDQDYYDAMASGAAVGQRINGVTLHVAKAFDEKYRQAIPKLLVMRDLARGGTPMGESMVTAGKLLASRPEKRKVMLVFGDGAPTSGGNGINANQYVTHTCHALEKSGIEVVLLGIKTPAMSGLWNKNATVNNLHELAKTTIKELASALHV